MRNREIKIRVWCDNKWINGIRFGEVITQMNCNTNTVCIHNGHTEAYNVCMFTGLKDKNGKEIYEGDIVECKYGVGAIIYSPFSLGFQIDANGRSSFDDKHGQYWTFHAADKMTYDVIGNIFQNPELLK